MATNSPTGGAASMGPSWWDRLLQMRWDARQGGHTLILRGKSSGFRDADCPALFAAVKSFLARNVAAGEGVALELDLAENGLSDAGVAPFLEGLRAMSQDAKAPALRLRVLKLWKNSLGDAAAEAVARLVFQQPLPVHEIHLSHNNISARGFVALLAATSLHPSGAYPWMDASGWEVPCWLRLEHNAIPRVEQLLQLLARSTGLRSCWAPRGPEGSCSNTACLQTSSPAAHVHLYCAREQQADFCHNAGKDEKLLTEVRDMLHQQDDLPSFGDPGGTPTCPVASSDLLVPVRKVQLHVDPEKGAGLDLEATDLGYHVSGVDGEGPGQELGAGDVIFAAEGTLLWGLDEEELEEAFGSRFVHGLLLHCAPFDDLQSAGLWQPLGVSLDGRSAELQKSLEADLRVMSQRCGLAAELRRDEGAVLLSGPAAGLRQAVAELEQLVPFYFPEVHLANCWALPASGWLRGLRRPEASVLCTKAVVPEQGGMPVPSAGGAEDADKEKLETWHAALQKQVSELDEDEEGPFDPLEAPDDGPEIFEGQALSAVYHQVWQPLRLLLLVGLPGSGKSTLAARLQDSGWVTVNQDTLGSREACLSKARSELAHGQSVVVDRCNVTCAQRQIWLCLADEERVCAGCLWLDVHPDECGRRVLRRFDHPTLAAEPRSLGVIWSFAERFEPPCEPEGFVLWQARDDCELELQLSDLLDLAQRPPGASGAASAAAPVVAAGGGGRRARRAAFLRALRRQVEYYFSDKNLAQDWFFQEKIREPPEEGWLAVDWVLSCPRVRDVLKASEEDLLQALGPSRLMLRRGMDGRQYVKRGRPLPELKEARPERGCEPAWYKEQHGTVPEAAAGGEGLRLCGGCQRSLPAASFSGSQLRKKNKAPLCSDCIEGTGGQKSGAAP